MSDATAPSRKRGWQRLWTVPNALSVLRLPLAAAFVIAREPWARAFVLTVGWVTDVLDGWIARRLGRASGTGAVLDALFDRLFMFVALGALFLEGRLDLAMLLVLVARDLYTAGGVLVVRAAGWDVPLRARAGGKLVTVLQVAALYALVLRPDRAAPFVGAVGLAAVYAILDYSRVGWQALRRR